MFREKIIEKIYSDEIISKIPVLYVVEMISIFEKVMEEVKEENPYGSISELFDE